MVMVARDTLVATIMANDKKCKPRILETQKDFNGVHECAVDHEE